MGWTPSITVQRDSHRRIIGYQAEPEWDETERDWMRALAAIVAQRTKILSRKSL